MPSKTEPLQDYSKQLDLFLHFWTKQFAAGNKMIDPNFARCISLIQYRSQGIMEELGRLQDGGARSEGLDWVFNTRFEYLGYFSQHCYSDGSKEAEHFEATHPNYPWPRLPLHQPPPPPLLDPRPPVQDASLRTNLANVVTTLGDTARRAQREGLMEQTGNLLNALGITDQSIVDLASRVTAASATLPQTSSNSSHESHHHFGSDLAIGAAARRIHHQVGAPSARSFELAAVSAFHDASEDSENPVRDGFLSATFHLGTLEAAALAVPSLPAFLTVTGIHAVEGAAQVGEESINHFLATHSAEQYRNDVSPEMRAEGVPDLYQLAQFGQGALVAMQLPGRGLHIAQHTLVEHAGNFLDAIGVTDQNLSQAAVVPAVLPPQTFVP